ncbi:MAG: polyprenyl synthetase family protein [Myxococcota bacterium]
MDVYPVPPSPPWQWKYSDDAESSIERGLALALPPLGPNSPWLHRAMHHAVFPGGRRVRPRLALTIAMVQAETAAERELALRAACAVELIHCASLVHDDLPCFDDAPIRRGRATVHAEYGVPLAVLVGDALLTLAFELLAEPGPYPERALALCRELALATGAVRGIIGGQAMECERPVGASGAPGPAAVDLRRYHHLKTTSLFCFAAEIGALASGECFFEQWGQIGHWLGAAFQLADDLLDCCSSDRGGGGGGGDSGKPVGRDAALGRPNAVIMYGEGATRLRLQTNLEQARACARACTPVPEAIIAVIDEVECALVHYCQGAA